MWDLMRCNWFYTGAGNGTIKRCGLPAGHQSPIHQFNGTHWHENWQGAHQRNLYTKTGKRR